MKRLFTLVAALLLASAIPGSAQFGSFGDQPIEINAESTKFEGGIAYADDSVLIRYGTTTIYCDHAEYNPETRDVLVQGNVRIYREGQLFTGERALYNLETKRLDAADFAGEFSPFRFSGDTLSSLGPNAYLVTEGIFTTSPTSKPDYFIRAKRVRIYPDDRIVFSNVTVYVGRTPVFWLPYVFQTLDEEQGFTFTPGYNSTWGTFLLVDYRFPITDNWGGNLRLDLMSKRGVGIGFESDWESGKKKENWGRFRSYYIDDASPGTNKTALDREEVDSARYRISLQSRTYLTEDIYLSTDINKLSDRRFLQDFKEGNFRRDPNPDNMISLTKWDENYAATFLVRKNLNEDDFDMTERLPELALDVKRQPLFGSGFFYESESSVGWLRRNFASHSLFDDYDTLRADTFHQILYPKTFFGWLSVVPRVGVRATYYQDSGFVENRLIEEDVEFDEVDEDGNPVIDPITGRQVTRSTKITRQERVFRDGGSLFRPVINAGIETSFKLSKAYEQVQARKWGLDGLRHVIQPYMNAGWTWSGEDPSQILQFDRITGSTKLPPIDYPQFNTIDTIDTGTIIRLGVRNRLQTRRDNMTFSWLELDTFFDIWADKPDYGIITEADGGTMSNLHTRLRWNPLPWVNLNLDSQLPIFDDGFTEINTNLNFLATRDVQVSIGHRYLSGHPYILNSNLVSVGGYVRFTDNWAFSFRESYEFDTSTLESQRYEIHRDLSSWIASLGLVIRDNSSATRDETEVGVLLTFTLKDLPNLRLPLAFDPSDLGGGGGEGRNR